MSLLDYGTKLRVPKEFVLQSLKQIHGGCISETRGNWSYSDVIHLSLSQDTLISWIINVEKMDWLECWTNLLDSISLTFKNQNNCQDCIIPQSVIIVTLISGTNKHTEKIYILIYTYELHNKNNTHIWINIHKHTVCSGNRHATRIRIFNNNILVLIFFFIKRSLF